MNSKPSFVQARADRGLYVVGGLVRKFVLFFLLNLSFRVKELNQTLCDMYFIA